MQIRINNKLMMIGLLLCFLLLTSYLNVIDANSVFSAKAAGSDSSPRAAGSGHSSMAGGLDVGQHDYMTAANTLAEFSASSFRQSRSTGGKTHFDLLPACVTLLTAFYFFSSRQPERAYATSFSGIITIFLLKKDGKK